MALKDLGTRWLTKKVLPDLAGRLPGAPDHHGVEHHPPPRERDQSAFDSLQGTCRSAAPAGSCRSADTVVESCRLEDSTEEGHLAACRTEEDRLVADSAVESHHVADSAVESHLAGSAAVNLRAGSAEGNLLVASIDCAADHDTQPGADPGAE